MYLCEECGAISPRLHLAKCSAHDRAQCDVRGCGEVAGTRTPSQATEPYHACCIHDPVPDYRGDTSGQTYHECCEHPRAQSEVGAETVREGRVVGGNTQTLENK